MARTASGTGYWLAAADGGVFTFGGASFYGSTGGIHLNRPVTAIVAAPTGGYWEVAADGGVFNFGAPYLGSSAGSAVGQVIGTATS